MHRQSRRADALLPGGPAVGAERSLGARAALGPNSCLELPGKHAGRQSAVVACLRRGQPRALWDAGRQAGRRRGGRRQAG